MVGWQGTPGLSFGAREKKMGWNSQPTVSVRPLLQSGVVTQTHFRGNHVEGDRQKKTIMTTHLSLSVTIPSPLLIPIFLRIPSQSRPIITNTFPIATVPSLLLTPPSSPSIHRRYTWMTCACLCHTGSVARGKASRLRWRVLMEAALISEHAGEPLTLPPLFLISWRGCPGAGTRWSFFLGRE